MKDHKFMMTEIVRVCGGAEANRLVADAYNTEILSNRLGRLEDQANGGKLARSKQNLLHLAIERVHEVVTFCD